MGVAELLASLLALLGAPAAAPAPVPPAPQAAPAAVAAVTAAPPDIKLGVFAAKIVTLGKDMSVRFQARNLGDEPAQNVTVVLTISDQEELLSVDCGVGTLIDNGDGCHFATIPPHTLVKMKAKVNVCCEGKQAINAVSIPGTGLGDIFRTTIRKK